MISGKIGDLHLPFTHPLYLEFCQDTFEKWNVTGYHFVGDVADQHAISFWEHNPNGLSAESERQATYDEVQRWHEAFEGTVCIGNHDERQYRVARKAGLPDHYLKSYADVWDTPRWKWDFEFVIDGVLHRHGTGWSDFLKAATDLGTSVCGGHLHSKGGVSWHTTPYNRLFALNAGCGVDEDRYAFEYGKHSTRRGTLGCGIVIDGEQAHFEIMPCGKGEKYHRSRAGKKRTKFLKFIKGIKRKKVAA